MTMTRSLAAIAVAAIGSLPGCLVDAGADDDPAEDNDTVELGASPVKSLASCADPGAMAHGGDIYVTCTGGGFPIYKASGPKGPFTLVGHVFPNKVGAPAWAVDDFWAPELHHVDGKIIAYFSAKHATTGKHAIGAAWATSPEGPYTALPQPLVSDPNGSKIDVHELTWKGRHFLYWKAELFKMVNGHSVQADKIRARELAADGLSFKGSSETHTVLSAKEPWEAGVVEAPWVFESSNGGLYMFYSGAYFCNSSYGIGVAKASHPLHAFVRETMGKDGLILASGDRWLGPGHNAVIRDEGGKAWSFFHAYDDHQGIPRCAPKNGQADNNHRHLLSAPVAMSNGFPRIGADL